MRAAKNGLHQSADNDPVVKVNRVTHSSGYTDPRSRQPRAKRRAAKGGESHREHGPREDNRPAHGGRAAEIGQAEQENSKPGNLGNGSLKGAGQVKVNQQKSS